MDEFRLGRVIFVSVLLGILGNAAAFVLIALIGLFLNLFWFGRIGFEIVEPHNSPYAGQWWTIFFPVIGGILISLMLKYGSKVISGHGIPEAMEAVLYKGSRIKSKVAILKPISAAVSIGSGGPYGAEGPIIMTGGAIGSLLGQWIPSSSTERKVMLAAGAAAGMVGIFGTPIAAVLLAIELLVFEFSARVFIPISIAAGVAAAVRNYFMGESGPLFPNVPIVPIHGIDLVWFIGFGVLAGIAAILITWLVYRVEDLYGRIPGLPPESRPILGAFMVGVIGIFFPRVLGVGYDSIAGILSGNFPLQLIVSIVIWKLVAWSLSLGSGTSGGILAPVLMIGGAMGALLGYFTLDITGIPVGMVALVFMGAVFGASTRATLTAIMFAAEITGHFDALVPLMISCAVADFIAVQLFPYNIMTGKLVKRGKTIILDYISPSALYPKT